MLLINKACLCSSLYCQSKGDDVAPCCARRNCEKATQIVADQSRRCLAERFGGMRQIRTAFRPDTKTFEGAWVKLRRTDEYSRAQLS